MHSTEPYVRARITGILCSVSRLHVGDGSVVEPRTPGRKRDKSLIQSVCLDAAGRPFLPGSTLRGALRGRAPEEMKRRLFGYIDQGANSGRAGAVRVFDARLSDDAPQAERWGAWDGARHTALKSGIAKAPITGTAEGRKLFRHEFVPPGTRFRLELEADNIAQDDLTALLDLLGGWDGAPGSGIGRGRATLKGQLKWIQEKIEVIDKAAMSAWLSDSREDPPKYAVVSIAPATGTSTSRPQRVGIVVRIVPRSPLLVNDPGLVRDTAGAPDLEFSRTPDGKAMVPAESLKGAIRARARRILLTLLAPVQRPNTEKRADQLVEALFGKTGQRSPFWVGDAISLEPAAKHVQTFNAIDRFLGAVAGSKRRTQAIEGEDTTGAGGKLYTVCAAACRALRADVCVDTDRVLGGDWWKGLLLLVARDAFDADIAFGWGASRGYGNAGLDLSLDETAIDSWEKLVAWAQRSGRLPAFQAWINALHDELAREERAHG